MKILLFTLVILQSASLLAFEYSPFRCYYKVRDEAAHFEKMKKVVNDFTSKRLAEAIEAANESKMGARATDTSGNSCNLETIEAAVKSKLDDEIVGQVEEFADKNEDYACHIDRKDSVYSDGLTFDVMTVLDVFTKKGSLQPMVYMCGKSFGVDKFGHFMAQGHTYMKRIREAGDPDLAPGFKYGAASENGFYGLSSTGVKSYGDLGANLAGMVFWQHLYSEDGSDPLAYVKCQDGKFVATERSWDWCDHALSSWDEANNCSEFNENYAEVVPKNLKIMAKRDSKPYQCPMEKNVCVDAVNEARELIGSGNYSKFKNIIISPICQKAASEVWRKEATDKERDRSGR